MDALRDDPVTWRTALPVGALAGGLGALGVLTLGSGDFAFQWQPVPPDVPGRHLEPADQHRERAAAGAWLAAALLLGWTALHVPAVAHRPGSVVDWLGIAETAAMASAALAFAAVWSRVAAADAIRRGATVVFGLCALVFGLSHFAYADFTASMIPAWLPARVALAWLTGVAHALAGLAIVAGVLRPLAAALEGVMMAAFVVLVHVPRVLAHADQRIEWTMLFVAVTLAASAGLVARLSQRAGRT